MKRVLSIFFNNDRTYITKVLNSPDGLKLEYLNATNEPIDLDALHTDEQTKAFDEIDQIIHQAGKDFDHISIVFPADSLLISHMPSKKGITKEEIINLIGIELKRTFPNLNITNFQIQVFQLTESKSKINKQVAVVFQNNDLSVFEQYFSKYEKEINFPYVSQISAANCFMYNYPELKNKNAAVVGIQNNYIDFCVISNGNLVYFGLESYNSLEQIQTALEAQIEKVLNEIVDDLAGGIYFYGRDVNQQTFISCWETAMIFGAEGKRLGTFRMLKSELDERDLEYTFKTAQYYAPCIGAAIPLYFDSIIL